MLRGKFIVLNAFIKRLERSQMNDLIPHPEELERKNNLTPKLSKEKK